MDELGAVKSLGYPWQTLWGAPKTTPSQLEQRGDGDARSLHSAGLGDVRGINRT